MAWAVGAASLASCERTPRALSAEELAAIKAELKAELRAELDQAAAGPTPTGSAQGGPGPRDTSPEPAASGPRRDAAGGGADARGTTKPAAPAGDEDDDPELSPRAPGQPEPSDAVDREVGPAREVRSGVLVYPRTSGLAILDLAVGTAMTEGQPREVRSRYARPPEVFVCYTLLENTGEEQTITHVWRRGARLVSRIELSIGKSRKWSTWSRQRTRPDWTGPWSCEVQSADGRRLGIASFEVDSPP